MNWVGNAPDEVEPREKMTKPKRFLVAIAVLVAAGVLFSGWWWGRGVQSWWTAREFVEAVKRGDCVAAAKYFPDGSQSSGCSPASYGLPDDLANYSLDWDRVGHRKYDDETAVGLKVPRDKTYYSLGMVRQGFGWVVVDIYGTA